MDLIGKSYTLLRLITDLYTPFSASPTVKTKKKRIYEVHVFMNFYTACRSKNTEVQENDYSKLQNVYIRSLIP